MARDRRLTAGSDMLKQMSSSEGKQQGKDVEVVALDKEWNEAEDSDEDDQQLYKSATKAHQAREQRLSRMAEALMLAPVTRDSFIEEKDVEVVISSKEWGELDDYDEEAEGERSLQAARGSCVARERRLSQMLMSPQHLQEVKIGPDHSNEEEEETDTDGSEVHFCGARVSEKKVEVVAQSKEWGHVDDSDEDDGDYSSRHASFLHEAREKRLSVGAEAMKKAS